jgi:hypothetical protein
VSTAQKLLYYSVFQAQLHLLLRFYVQKWTQDVKSSYPGAWVALRVSRIQRKETVFIFYLTKPC